MIYRFTHISGANASHVDTVETTPITLGRDDSCQVKFDKFKDLAVSSQHAQITEISEGTWQIASLSRNGIVVNGVPCDTSAKLPNHATIQLGRDGPRLRFDVDQTIGGGVTKADVQKKTQKLRKDVVMSRERAPDTEERPVFNVPAAPAKRSGGMPMGVLVGIVVALLLVVSLVVFLVVH